MPVRSKCAAWAVDAVKKFEEEVKQPVKIWRSAGDKDYLGVFKGFLSNDRCVTDIEYTNREDPQENAGPESRVGRWKERVRANFGYAPDNAWPLCGRFTDDVENILS